MLTVDFLELGQVPEEKLAYAVLISRFQNQFLYAQHRKRFTWELPGGKKEVAEKIDACAARELQEETGAMDFQLTPLFIYRVTKEDVVDYGQVYLAEIVAKNHQLINEIGRVALFNQEPPIWTYPLIQPFILQHYLDLYKRS